MKNNSLLYYIIYVHVSVCIYISKIIKYLFMTLFVDFRSSKGQKEHLTFSEGHIYTHIPHTHTLKMEVQNGH